MIYELGKLEDLQAVYNVVQHTIKTIYPKYYPMEVVDFFCEHHSEDAIEKDINNGYVSVLKIDGTIVATGCFVDNHITRVYVLPEHQKKGYGTFIMKNIEEQIGEKFDKAYLDASLPAAALKFLLHMTMFLFTNQLITFKIQFNNIWHPVDNS